MRHLLATLALVLAPAVVATAPQGAPSPADTARLIQSHYATVKSFAADFSRTFRGGLLPQTTVQKGDVKILKPGRMRWTYKKPDDMEFVADGKALYSYIKADRTVYVNDVPTGDGVSTAILFLAGKGDLLRDFRASAAAPGAPDELRVLLTPITPQAEFTKLTLGVDARTLKLMSMETLDSDGGVSTFRFENLRENVSFGDRDFLFTIPKGVDVIR
jgi:outer membrane lipoprotein carrier protein